MKKYLLSAFFAVALMLPWASKAQTGCDKIQDYTVTTGPAVGSLAAPITAMAGYADSVLNYRDNNGIAQIAMPFSMVFGSEMINAGDPLYISRNGFVSFTAPTAYNTMPATKVIAPLACTGSNVYSDGALNIYKAYDATLKTLTIEWSNASLNGTTFSFQVVLSKDDNGIEFLYSDTVCAASFTKKVLVSSNEYINCIANTGDPSDYTSSNTSFLSLTAIDTIANCKFSLVCRKTCRAWATNVTNNSATINWSDANTPSKYQIVYSKDEALVANAVASTNTGVLALKFPNGYSASMALGKDSVYFIEDDTTAKTFSRFEPNTTYYFAVRTYISGSPSKFGIFSPMGSFTTEMDTIVVKRDTVCMSKTLAHDSSIVDASSTTYTIDTIWDANSNVITALNATDTVSYYTLKDNTAKFYKIRMNTVVKSLTTQDNTVNVCDTFYWDNIAFTSPATPTTAQTYTENTILIDTLKAVADCKINSLHLTIRNSSFDTVYDTACSSYTWHIVGNVATGSVSIDSVYTLADDTTHKVSKIVRTFKDTLLINAVGCKRTTSLNLVLNNNIYNASWIDTTLATSEGQYVYNGKRYFDTNNVPGKCVTDTIPYFVGTDSYGCDSLRAVQLHVGTSLYTAYDTTACAEFTWDDGDGKTYAQLDENAPAGARYRNMTDGGYVYNSALPSHTFPGKNNNVSDSGTFIPDTVVSLRLTLRTGYYAEATLSHNMTNDTLWLSANDSLLMADYRTIRHDTTVDATVRYGVTDLYCDSIIHYHLNLVYNYTEVPMTICMSEMGTPSHDITWTPGGTPITYTIPTSLNPRNDTTYIAWADEYVRYDETDSAQGYILVLSVKKNTYSYDTVEACDTYTWHGTTYSLATPGVYSPNPKYTIEGGAFNGCDSVMLLHLTLNAAGATVAETVNETVCNSYEWQGTTYTNDTTVVGNPYVDTLTHCNVVPTLVLHIATGGNSTIVDSACDSYTWHDSTYTVSTTATYTVAGAASGECDSVVTLNLTIFFSEIDTIADVVCNGHDYNRNGFSIAASAYANRNDFTAVRIERGATVHHCNIVHMLNLTVGNTQVFDTTIVACDNYIWHGTTFTNDVYLVDTVANAQGCDSITNLTIQIVASTSDTTAATACDSYTWSRNATTYTAAGTYTATETAGPCTTTHVLVLNLGTNSNVTIDTTACAAFVWDGTTYTTSQTITLPGTNAQGCDSNYIINLTVQNATNVSVVEQACGVFVWSVNGQTYTTTSTDTYEFGNCDSVYVLNVTIYPVYTQNFNVTACESYEWNDSVYTANTTATATFPTVDNCDSVVTINLSLGQSYTTDTAVAGCNSVVYDGVTYYESTERYDRYTTDYGCDSIISLVITVNHSGYSYEEDTAYNAFYTWHGQTCTSTGAYIDTLPAHGEFCDSIYILNLYVMDTTEGIELSEMGEISLYPNPTTGVLNISADNVVRVDVLDLVGRTVARFENTNRFDISRLPAGAYTLRIATTDRVMVSKVVKR